MELSELHNASNSRFHVLTNQFLNSLAVHPSNYWICFVTDPVTVVLFIYWNTAILQRSIYVSLACYVGGILTVSLCEYSLHRWVFHSSFPVAHAGHAMHHDSPRALLGFPWFVTAALWWSIAYISVNVLHIPFALSFIAAFITGYTVYGVTHHILHHHNIGGRWLRKLRIHHYIHHRFSDVNFGVTNRFWDKVFGTTFDRQAYKRRMSSVVKSRETRAC
jgi:sterol desaturase/sphingolipid hydroxylase (fatty acid hydroxylase superfamily)